MVSSRKKPSAAFWITVALVAVLVGYPLSIGPAYRIFEAFGEPAWAKGALAIIYVPIWWAAEYSPAILRLIFSYLILWGVHE